MVFFSEFIQIVLWERMDNNNNSKCYWVKDGASCWWELGLERGVGFGASEISQIQVGRGCQVRLCSSTLQLVQSMDNQQRNANKPKSYAKIPLNKRQQLVELVCFKKWTIARASIKTSIKLSTAKLILKKYKEEGTFFQKREERLARIRSEQPQPRSQNPEGLQAQPIFGYINPPQIQQPFLAYDSFGVNNCLAFPTDPFNGAYYMSMGDPTNPMIFYGGMGLWG